MSKDIVSGVGVRYGVILALDATTSLPLPPTTTAVPYTGVEIEGIKTATANDPAPRNIPHYGQDRAYAQDSLPPDTLESFAVTTSKTNMVLDTVLEGTKIRSYAGFEARIANNDKKGSEPQIMAFFYRQALDTDKNSATFGKLRQWNGRTYPSARLVPQTDGYEKEATDKTYNGTPTNTGYTPWNEDINTTNWGANEGAHLEQTFNAQPRINTYRGNGTLNAFQLSVPPVDTTPTYTTVFVDGTIVTPSAVVAGANPAFTLTVTPGVDKLVYAIVQTNSPN
jgi:hypothetical protein